MTQPRLLLALTLLLTLESAAATRILNIDFGNAAVQPAPVGKAAAGNSDSDVWNLSSNPFIPDAGLDNLFWSDGTRSGVNLRITNAPGAWTVPLEDKMFNIYAYNGGGPITVTLTGLPSGNYDIYAYGHGEQDSMTTTFEVNAGSGLLPAQTTEDSVRWRILPFQEGAHYVLFRNVRVQAGIPLVTIASPAGASTPFLNGIQIVEREAVAGELVNIDFGNATVQAPPVGTAAVGFGSSDIWNLYSSPFISVGAIEDLLWSTGASSGASLYVTNAPGAWTVPVADNMFNIYAYSYGGPIEVTVSNLPPGTYAVYAYGHGERDDLNTRFSVVSDGVSRPDKSTGTSPRWRTLPFQEGEHYVVFGDVTVSEGKPIIITASPVSGASPFLNGIQILRSLAALPQIRPEAGYFTNLVEVTLEGAEAGTELRYTLDGSIPTSSSLRYSEPLRIRSTTTVSVRRFKGDLPDSETVTAEYRRVYAVDDGLSTEWRIRYFGQGYLTDPRVGAFEDPDGDGATNLAEFSAGSDPLDPLSGFTSEVRMLPSIEWKSVARNSYRILRKRHLTDPEWTEVGKVTATGSKSQYLDESSDGLGYYYVVEPVR